ncbi:MAG: hypothetical protein KTR24_18100, partial [Saprospiraceae bacterium]|nr:hypothetical protein [Saprospiraceae bacterium]
MPAIWHEGEIVKMMDEGPLTRRFWLETESTLDFRPGQFITADLPIHEKRNKRWRSYSIANVPHLENGLIELCIVKLEDGAASRYLFEDVEIGTTISFKGPAGNFVLPENLDQDLVMICTGTGVAPFRSMLQDLEDRDQYRRSAHL